MAGQGASAFFGTLLLLTVRGVLLWFLVPLEALAWILLCPWLLGRGATLGRFLGWADQNLIAALQRSLLRPLFRGRRVRFVPFNEVGKVIHRLGIADPV